MNLVSESRQQKIIESFYRYLIDISNRTGDSNRALGTCKHLLALRDRAIDDSKVNDFEYAWKDEHPEEDPLTSSEIINVVKVTEEHLVKEAHRTEVDRILLRDPRARMQIINGGLSAQPDEPYALLDIAGR